MTTVTLTSLENIKKGFIVVGSKFINANHINMSYLNEHAGTQLWIQFTGGSSLNLISEELTEFIHKYNQFLNKE